MRTDNIFLSMAEEFFRRGFLGYKDMEISDDGTMTIVMRPRQVKEIVYTRRTISGNDLTIAKIEVTETNRYRCKIDGAVIVFTRAELMIMKRSDHKFMKMLKMYIGNRQCAEIEIGEGEELLTKSNKGIFIFTNTGSEMYEIKR